MTQIAFSYQGIEIACLDQGGGTPLVLIHGFPFDYSMWQPQIAAFSKRFRVIAPDLRGFGKSSLLPSDVVEGVAMERYAADVVATLDYLQVDQPAIMCGFSMGGYVLWQLVLHHSERIKALVLCDTRAAADSAEASAARLDSANEVLHSGVAGLAEGMLPKLLAPQTLAGNTHVVQHVGAMMRTADPGAVAAALRGMACREDVRSRLPSINLPSLLLAGAADAISQPAEMREIAALLPRAEFKEIADAGHMTTL